MIERAIDYIQASVLLSESRIIMKGFKPIPPVRFYKRGYLHPQGFRMYFGNPNSTKANVIGAGQILGSLRNDGYQDAQILDWFLSQDAEISRLDLAVTEWIEDDFCTTGDVALWYQKELVESSLASGGGKTISSLVGGAQGKLETVYIGDIKRRARKGIFRAYDKGIELGIGSEMVTRLELELKRENANAAAKRIAETNDIAGNFRAKFDVKSPDFERLMETPAVKVTRGKNKLKTPENEALDKRWDWLIEKVAPSLLAAIEDDRKQGLGDVRLMKFLQRSGLLEDMRSQVVANANKLHDNYLQSIGVHNGRFSSEDLD